MKNILNSIHPFAVRFENMLALNSTRRERYLSYFRNYIENAQLVLDVGCGSGDFEETLTISGSRVISLDLSKKQLKKCDSANCERICGDAQHLPFPQGLFDCILSFSLMEHLPVPSAHAKECYRVLKLNGYAVFQLPNPQYIIEPHTKLPLVSILPKKIQMKILREINYYINFGLTINKALAFLIDEGFKLMKVDKIFHSQIMKLLPISPAYMLILSKHKK